MNNALISAVLAVCASLAQCQSTPTQLKAWEGDAQQLLSRLGPDGVGFEVSVFEDDTPRVWTQGRVINVSSEVFRYFRDPAARAALLYHEVGHVALQQEPAEEFNWFGKASYDWPLLVRNEKEADWWSARALHWADFDVCAGAKMHGALVDGFNMRRSPDTPVHKMMLDRLGLWKVYCYNQDKLDYMRP